MAFLYYSPLSINAAQVPSTQTDFPVLVSVTSARFKTTGNGGHVANANGYDIRPYTDAGLTSAITGYELERYNGNTGELLMWVKVSSLSSSTTPFYLAYGDASIVTDASSTTTWSSSFLGVYHLKDGTTLDVNSATGTRNGTNHSATAVSGQIDGAANVNGSPQYVDIGTQTPTAAVTLSAWVNSSNINTGTRWVLGSQHLSPNRYQIIMITSAGKLECDVFASANVAYSGTGSHTLVTGTWYYLTMTYDSSSGLIGYVNAGSDATVAANGALDIATNQETQIGYNLAFATQAFIGSIDEARWASVARSANWITTEYNNQFSPGTFETLGAEVGTVPFVGLYTK